MDFDDPQPKPRNKKHMGCARLQDLTARLTTRANDSHAAPDTNNRYHTLLRLGVLTIRPFRGARFA